MIMLVFQDFRSPFQLLTVEILLAGLPLVLRENFIANTGLSKILSCSLRFVEFWDTPIVFGFGYVLWGAFLASG